MYIIVAYFLNIGFLTAILPYKPPPQSLFLNGC